MVTTSSLPCLQHSCNLPFSRALYNTTCHLYRLLSRGIEAVVEGVCLDGRRDDAVVAAAGPGGDAHVEHDVLVADRGQATKLSK